MSETARARRTLRRAVDEATPQPAIEVIGSADREMPHQAALAIRRLLDRGRAIKEGSRR